MKNLQNLQARGSPSFAPAASPTPPPTHRKTKCGLEGQKRGVGRRRRKKRPLPSPPLLEGEEGIKLFSYNASTHAFFCVCCSIPPALSYYTYGTTHSNRAAALFHVWEQVLDFLSSILLQLLGQTWASSLPCQYPTPVQMTVKLLQQQQLKERERGARLRQKKVGSPLSSLARNCIRFAVKSKRGKRLASFPIYILRT